MPLVEARVEEVTAEKERRSRGEELREEAARLSGDLRAFMRAAWHIVEPRTALSPNWHLDAIADHLQAAYEREIRRLLINVPPGAMKSLMVSVFGPAWQWTHTPEERFLTASYGEKLATRDAVKTRRLIQSAWYRARWGDVFSLTGDQNQKTRYENDRTGYRIATSVGGTGTGERASIIQLDDPHNAEEILSDTVRKAVLEWHDGTISTRFNDPASGIEILIMQRLHEADLAGHVLEQGDWTHLCLPAEYEPRLLVRLPGGETVNATCPPERRLPSGRTLAGDPRTEPGELLHPEHNPPGEHERTRTVMGSYKAAGQLQQRPAPSEGGILKRHWWRYFPSPFLADGSEDWTAVPPFRRLIQFWDTSLKEKTTSDYCVGALWGVAGANRYLLRVARGQWGLPETKTQLRLLTQWARDRWPVLGMAICVELAANGPEVVAQLRDEIPGIVGVPVGGDKVQRAHAAAPQLEAGNVFVPGGPLPDGTSYDPALTPPWAQSYIDEAAAFNHGAYDDQVDTLTGALIRAGVPVLAAVPAGKDDQPEERRALSAGLREQVF